MSLGERLKSERERLGLSQTALAKACGVGKTTQINYEKNFRSPDANYLRAAQVVGVRTYWVVFGEHNSEPVAINENHLGEDLSKKILDSIPLYDVEGAAGAGRSLEHEEVAGSLQLDPATLQTLGIQDVKLAGIRVRGDSMEPTLSDNDWVIINLDDQNYARVGVFLIWVSGELRIKRIQRLAGGAALLISDNTVYEREIINPDKMQEFAVLGRVELRLGEIS